MKRVLMVTAQESLGSGLESATAREDVTFERVPDWETARDRLVDAPVEAVCLDYESVKIEGMNSFVQLDNILQKEETQALIVLREATPRANQLVDALEALSATIDLSTDSAADFRSELHSLLDAKEDPDASPAGNAAPTTEIVLPDVSNGSLGEVSIARVIHTLRRQEQTGRLLLENDDMSRDFEIVGGLPAGGSSMIEQLQAAFAWSDGRFSFERDESLRGAGTAPYPLLLTGAQNHLDQREAMDELMPVMEQYVARTTFFERLRADEPEWIEDAALAAFVERADGETTLEGALSAVASGVLTAFQSGFFAIECDLVALSDEPISAPVDLTFSSRETSAEQTASGGRAGVSPDQTEERSSSDEPTTAERESTLRRTHERVSDASPYEVFDLWEGCGEEAVRERYYKLVKRHHPDSYGGNISDEAKELAEEIFIRIKRAHNELLKAEDEQTISRNEAIEANTSATTLDESLTSPSVTAMGSGGTESSAAEDTTGDDRRGSTTVEDDPRTERTQTARPSDDSSRPRYDSPPERSDRSSATGNSRDDRATAGSGEAEPTDDGEDDRAEKLKRLKDRLGDSDGDRSKRKTPFKPDVRREKLSSLRRDPDEERSAKVERFEPPESDDEAQEYFNTGYRAFKNDDEAKAHTLFEKAFEYDPSHPLWKTFYAYTLFLVDSSERDRSEELLREVLESDHRQARPDAHLFVGRILKVKERHKYARKHFERALELNPDSVEARRELRVYEMRDQESSDPESDESSDGFLGNLFGKDIF